MYGQQQRDREPTRRRDWHVQEWRTSGTSRRLINRRFRYWFRFKFKEGGIPHELDIADNVYTGDEDYVEFDGQKGDDPHVGMRVTPHGIDTLAVIVKCAFKIDGQAKSYRFDGHFPLTEVGGKILQCIFSS